MPGMADASKSKFEPVTFIHPGTGTEVLARTPGRLARLTASGWKRHEAKPPAAPPSSRPSTPPPATTPGA